MPLAYTVGTGYAPVNLAPFSGMGAPPSSLKADLGQSYYDKSTSPPTEYRYNGQTWVQIAAIPSAGSFTTVTATGNITSSAGDLVATAGNVTAGAAVSAGTTVTAGTGITATTGAITASNGNLVLSTAGNKLSIATGANASVGTSAAMTAGVVTVNTTAVTASSIIFLTANTAGGTQGTLRAPVADIVAGTSFVIRSSNAADTSTVNWWIIN